MDQPNYRVLRFDRFALDLTRGCLRDAGQEVNLRPKAFEILCHLAENAGRLVPKQELFDAVWPNVIVSDDSLFQCIRELREALGDTEHRLIKTVSRRGYLFDATVTVGAASAAAALPPHASQVRGRRNAVRIGSVSLLLVALAAATVFWFIQPRVSVTNSNQATPEPARWDSLVILPFQNLSGDPEQEYFADGITDDLTSSMSGRSPGRVISRNTAFAYKEKQVDVREVGRELDVRYVLEGGVERSGDRVRVTARLIDAPTAANLWTETFDIHRHDLDRLRDDVTARLARVLQIELIYAQEARSLRERPRDPTALDYLMRANAVWLRTPRGRDLSETRHLFREALRHDDSLATAWIGLGMTYTRGLRFSPTREDDLVQANIAAERAMALTPGSPWAHILQGWLLYETKRMDRALAAFEHAARLNPNETWAYASIAAANIMLGRAENALEPLRKAERLSPKDPALARWQMFAGAAYVHLQRDAEAVDWLTRSAALNPHDLFTHLFLACAHAWLGREAEAKSALAELLRLKPDFTLTDFKAREPSDTPAFRAQRERLYEGLRRAGVPE